MHAYLIIGNDTAQKELELTTKLSGKRFEFPVAKIEEVRELSAFLRNTQSENTIIVSHNIDEAGTEALNAFLKNLEEPQKNVTFILTARNEYKVLPTITSRCQIIKITNFKAQKSNREVTKFLNGTLGDKFTVIDKIKQRPEAVEFVQHVIEELHTKLNKNSTNYKQIANSLEVTQNTLNSLHANGNVSLQLTNLIVNLDAGQKRTN